MTPPLLLAALSLVQPVHDWYPYRCCSNRDCHAVEDVSEVEGGYRVEGLFVERWRAEPSHDRRYHICRVDRTILCFFVPLEG